MINTMNVHNINVDSFDSNNLSFFTKYKSSNTKEQLQFIELKWLNWKTNNRGGKNE